MSEDLKRIEEKLDEVLNALPMIYALGSVLVRRTTAIERTGVHKNTLDSRDSYREKDRRRTYVEIGEIPVTKNRKKAKKRA